MYSILKILTVLKYVSVMSTFALQLLLHLIHTCTEWYMKLLTGTSW